MPKPFELFASFDVKELAEENDYFLVEGYANTTTKDRYGDVIKAEAWEKGGLDNYKKNPVMLAYHDMKQPIGTMLEVTPTEQGLRVLGKIFKDAGSAAKMAARGVLKTFSVGFIPTEGEYDSQTDTLFITNLELLEVSVVSIPANQDSTFSIIKSLEDNPEKRTQYIKELTFKEPTEEEKALEAQKALELEAAAKAEADRLALEKEEAIRLEAEEAERKRKNMTTEVTDNTEKLLKELTDRITNQEKTFAETLEGIRTELAEKSADLEKIQKSKMLFDNRTNLDKISQEEKDNAVLLAKIMNKPLTETKYFNHLITKAGAHVPGNANDWEQTFNLNIMNDIRRDLVVEPLFTSIPMNTPTMQIPVNPEAGYGEWIASSAYNTANSTGTAAVHQLDDTTLVSYKLTAKEYIGYEEEEDTLLPVMGIVRDAVARRMAKSSDVAFLRGTAANSADPIAGLATIAATDSKAADLAGASKLTVAALQTMRRSLGVWGLQPSEVIYVVSTEGYFDLLEDDDFRTMDLVGSNATILTGQIGFANGSRVIVSGEFAAKANDAVLAVAVNTRNFVKGEHRSLMVERDKNIEYQRNIIVASRRLGFLQKISGQGVSSLVWDI